MVNNIEWAAAATAASTVTTAFEIFQSDPENRLLDPEYSWNTAIFAGDGVAVYADSPEELLIWLQHQSAAVQQIIDAQEANANYAVVISGGHLAPEITISTNPSDAAREYLRMCEDHVLEDEQRIDLLKTANGHTTTLATTVEDYQEDNQI